MFWGIFWPTMYSNYKLASVQPFLKLKAAGINIGHEDQYMCNIPIHNIWTIPSSETETCPVKLNQFQESWRWNFWKMWEMLDFQVDKRSSAIFGKIPHLETIPNSAIWDGCLHWQLTVKYTQWFPRELNSKGPSMLIGLNVQYLSRKIQPWTVCTGSCHLRLGHQFCIMLFWETSSYSREVSHRRYFLLRWCNVTWPCYLNPFPLQRNKTKNILNALYPMLVRQWTVLEHLNH